MNRACRRMLCCGLLVAASIGSALTRPPHAASHPRHARIYDASNTTLHSYGSPRKSSSFVPHRREVVHGPRASRAASSHRAPEVKRDARGRIARSSSARHEFQRLNPCPSTGRGSGKCPGYVIDHVRALKHGGADRPSNMQWQTVAAARAKDRIE